MLFYFILFIYLFILLFFCNAESKFWHKILLGIFYEVLLVISVDTESVWFEKI